MICRGDYSVLQYKFAQNGDQSINNNFNVNGRCTTRVSEVDDGIYIVLFCLFHTFRKRAYTDNELCAASAISVNKLVLSRAMQYCTFGLIFFYFPLISFTSLMLNTVQYRIAFQNGSGFRVLALHASSLIMTHAVGCLSQMHTCHI